MLNGQPLMDITFQSVNSEHILNKQQELDSILKNMRSMRTDNIFLDSVKLEDASVELYDNTAVAIFIVHTYKKEKGKAAVVRWLKNLKIKLKKTYNDK